MNAPGFHASASYDSCQCGGAQGVNPPATPDIGAIVGVVEDLGRALALGTIADRVGLPEGGELVDTVATFVRESPTLAAAYAVSETAGIQHAPTYRQPETGGVLGSIGVGVVEGIEGAAGAVERAAVSSFKAIRKLPLGTFAAVGAGLAVANQYFNVDERTRLADIAGRYALAGDSLKAWLDGATPEERAAYLATIGDLGAAGTQGGGSGWSFWTWAGIGLAAAAALWAWRRSQA